MNTCPKGAPPDDVTVMAAVPLFPSLVALIVMEPGVTPLTRPLVLTVATAVLELAHGGRHGEHKRPRERWHAGLHHDQCDKRREERYGGHHGDVIGRGALRARV